MTIFSNASWPELLRRASSASSHLHSAIFCRPNRPRPIDTWRTSAQTRPDGLGFAEASRNVDGGAIGQRHHWADAGGRHQALAHLVIPDDGQQAAMQDAELLAKRPSD